MTKNKIIIGSRESALAVLQSEMVKSFLNKEHPELHTEILTMKTTGDKKFLTVPLIRLGEKDFCKRAGSCSYRETVRHFCSQPEGHAYGGSL